MRIVGTKSEPLPTAIASSDALLCASAFNEMLQSVMPFGRVGYIPKGIYRFKTHEEANSHQELCLAKHMAKIEIKINGRSP